MERLPTAVFWPGESHGLESMGLLRVGQDWSDWAHTRRVLLLYFQSTYLFISVFHFLLGFPDSSVGKESACSAGNLGSIPVLGISAGEGIGYPLQYSWASLVAQLGKNPLAMWETWVWSLGWEDLLEKGKPAHSGILAWRIPWTYSPCFSWLSSLS